MADETIARATIQLSADGSKLAPEMASAVAKAQGALDRANKQMERAQASTFKAIQGHIDRINATKPTHEMRLLEQAVLKLGGSSKLTKDQLSRVTMQVNALAAAGAKVPASLSGLTGMGSKLSAAFSSLTSGGGVSGALAAIGPAGLAAAGALGAVTLAGTKAFGAISDLASQAEQWSNIAESTGLGIETVQQLSAMLEDAGIPAESLKKAMKALSDEVAGGGKQLAAFGVSIKGWDLMTQEERLRAFAKIVSEIEDPAVQSAVAVAGLGKSGADLIPVMEGVATGADKMIAALGTEQVAALKHADDVLDKFGRKWDHTKKIVLSSIVQMIQGFKGFAGVIPIFIPDAGVAAAGATAAPKPTSDAETERKKRAVEFAQKAARDKADRAAEAERNKRAAELLATRRKYNELQVSIVKHTSDEADLMRDLDEQSKSLLANQEKIAADQLSAQKETRLRGGDMLPSVGGAGLWTKYQDVLDQELANAAAKARGAAKNLGNKWDDALNAMAQGASMVGDAFGTAYRKFLSVIQSIGQSLQGFSSMSGTGKVGAIGGVATVVGSAVGGTKGTVLAGAGAGAATGAAIGSAFPVIGNVVGAVAGAIIGGVAGYFASRKAKKEAEEVAAMIGANFSTAQLAALKDLAKKAGKDWRVFLQEQMDKAAATAKAVEDRQKLEGGLSRAAQFAQQLQARIDSGGFSEKMKAAAELIIGKVRDALLKSGMGMQLDPALAKSEAFQGAQGAAGDIAGVLSGMREAGMVDEGLMGAAAGASQELFNQAVAAATEAGKAPAEAQKAGFGAISQLLREQLNASIQSGKELDANTQKLLDEAKKNGIEIMADPIIESLAVERKMLEALNQIAGQRHPTPNDDSGGDGAVPRDDVPAAGGFGPMITPNLGGGLGPRIQTHPGELAMVIPRSKMGPGALISAANGLFSDRGGGGFRRPRRDGSTVVNLTVAENPFQSSVGAERLRRYTLRHVERKMARKLAAVIQAGRG